MNKCAPVKLTTPLASSALLMGNVRLDSIRQTRKSESLSSVGKVADHRGVP